MSNVVHPKIKIESVPNDQNEDDSNDDGQIRSHNEGRNKMQNDRNHLNALDGANGILLNIQTIEMDDADLLNSRRTLVSSSQKLEKSGVGRRSRPHEPFTITWRHLKFQPPPTAYKRYVKGVHAGRIIFANLNGTVFSGQLTGLMGTSGSGKSSLMNIIWGVQAEGVTGRVAIGRALHRDWDGLDVKEKEGEAEMSNISLKIAMIPQCDSQYKSFTVYETIAYASRLKNHSNVTFDHRRATDWVIEELGLKQCRDTPIHRCSGGEQKRVSIGTELVSSPNILLLDEPTSGLDSSATKQTIELLRELAVANNMAIMVTIHQPSSKVLFQFDRLYVMSPYGGCIYEGPPTEIISHVQKSADLKCPPFYNPAEFIIEIAAHEHGPQAVAALVTAQRQLYSVSENENDDNRNQEQVDCPDLKHPLMDHNRNRDSDDHMTPFWRDLRILLGRHWKAILSDSHLNAIRFAAAFIYPLMFMSFYGTDVGGEGGCPPPRVDPLLMSLSDLQDLRKRQQEMRAAIGILYENYTLIFLLLMCLGFAMMMSMVMSIPLEIRMVAKEWRNRWYGLGTYYLSRNLAELPLQIITGLLTGLLTLWFTGNMVDTQRTINLLVVFQMYSLITQGIGLVIGIALCHSVAAGAFLTPLTLLPFGMVCGFWVRLDRMSAPLRAISYVSFMRHTFESILVAMYGHARCECEMTADTAEEDLMMLGGEISNGSRQRDPKWLDFLVLFHSLEGPNGTQLNGMETMNTIVRTLIVGDDGGQSGGGGNGSGTIVSTGCESYRSYALEEFDIPESVYTQWLLVMIGEIFLIRIAGLATLLVKIKSNN